MARWRTSGENLFVVLLISAPLSQKLEPPANPVRFSSTEVDFDEALNEARAELASLKNRDH
jgi:hypothetical protein